jgi:copper chaperone CopZ
MKRAILVTLSVILSAPLVLSPSKDSLADEKPVADRGEAIARVSVAGMQCDGTCPATVKTALADGPGIKDVVVDYAKKLATIRFDAEKTRASEAVARLVKLKPYSASQLSSVEAVLDTDYAKATASALVAKKGAKAKLRLSLEPKSGHAFNSERGAPDLEVELASLPAGIKAKEPLVKWKGGLKAAHSFDLEFDVDAKARTGEVLVIVEVRLQDGVGKDVKDRTISLAVPVLVP